MITAINRKKAFPVIVMLIALIGLTFSVMGETLSHGVPELTESNILHEGDHGHSHDHHSHSVQDHQDRHSHHDSGNHSHESADRLKMPVFSNLTPSLRRPVPFAGENPRSFRYRLDRPPKLYKIV
jgi:ABC-type nickel/cobalt efflux system permease component RcnA